MTFNPQIFLLLALLLAVPSAVVAQADESPAPAVVATPPDEVAARPRIGLVLGGGGARGAAHIGVLKELERQRIPIDAIAGTSMGAIVGGLYAAGMRAAELEEVVASLDWADTLADTPPRSFMSFRRKQDDADYPINFELGLRDGELLLPKGAIQGQKLDLLLQSLTHRVAHIDNFDDLPIPFRAVASDIERGEPHVMGQGDLAAAIRASMSVPGVFAPTRVDGRLLVDGGLVGNLPVDVMREMGVDVIIAVDVEFPLYSAEELDSALTISEQMLTILIRKETLRQIETLNPDDVLIRPALGTFASTAFGQVSDAIPPGVEATRKQQDKLAALALDEPAYGRFLAGHTAPAEQNDRLAFVRVQQDGNLSEDILASRVEVRAGDRINPRRLADDANRLYGLDYYERVGYQLVEEDGGIGVEFTAIQKTWGPNFLRFGLSLEDDFEGSTGVNLSTRLTRPAINARGGEWRTDLRLGTDPLLASEFHQPFGRASQFFVSPRLRVEQSNIDAFELDETIARLRLTEGLIGLDAGAELGLAGEFRAGIFRGNGEARIRVGDPALQNIDFDAGGVFARLRYDSLDDAQFPRSGSLVDISWTRSLPGLGADNKFTAFEADLSTTRSYGRNTLQWGVTYATTLNDDDALQNFFDLGGFLRLSGLERGEIAGPHAGLARLVYTRRVGDSAGSLFDVPLYLGASLEAGNVWFARDDIGIDTLQWNGSLFAGLDTYFGPMFLAAGLAEGGGTNFYLFIGSPPL